MCGLAISAYRATSVHQEILCPIQVFLEVHDGTMSMCRHYPVSSAYKAGMIRETRVQRVKY